MLIGVQVQCHLDTMILAEIGLESESSGKVCVGEYPKGYLFSNLGRDILNGQFAQAKYHPMPIQADDTVTVWKNKKRSGLVKTQNTHQYKDNLL